MPEPSARGVKMATERLKRHKPPGFDQIPAELITTGTSTFRSEVHKRINYIWNKKESIIFPIHKKGDKIISSSYRGISLLSNTYVILSNILLSNLTPYAEENFGDNHCGFRRNRITDHILYVIFLWKDGNKMKQCISYL